MGTPIFPETWMSGKGLGVEWAEIDFKKFDVCKNDVEESPFSQKYPFFLLKKLRRQKSSVLFLISFDVRDLQKIFSTRKIAQLLSYHYVVVKQREEAKNEIHSNFHSL